ncbi:gfo/Idh/MocA family oxidoreductase, partial [Halomonas sp. MG34]|nr:gfo/Idh/MocA family oxidoreductase [Halomonas sp. MG34]
METHKIGVIMNGVTGRMGTNQHLIRSIVAIREQGGVELANGNTVIPDPILVGRREARLEELAASHGITRWTTNLEEALADDYNQIYFDSQTTVRRAEGIRKAIAAGKHIYCEKPTATNLEEAIKLSELATEAGLKNGVVQDKLYLPGLMKLKRLIDSGFFGEILSVRMEFGYWVFEGDWQEGQRPSWNYRKEDGGGIIVDMFPH